MHLATKNMFILEDAFRNEIDKIDKLLAICKLYTGTKTTRITGSFQTERSGIEVIYWRVMIKFHTNKRRSTIDATTINPLEIDLN